MAYKRTRGLVRLLFGTVPDDQIHRAYRFRVALFFALVVTIVVALFLIYQLTQTLDRLYLAEGGRDRWQRQDDVIESLKLKVGNVVADVGCGVGSLSKACAEGCRARQRSGGGHSRSVADVLVDQSVLTPSIQHPRHSRQSRRPSSSQGSR